MQTDCPKRDYSRACQFLEVYAKGENKNVDVIHQKAQSRPDSYDMLAYEICMMAIGVWGGGAGGGAAAPTPKFGQTVGEIRANSGWNSGKARRKNRPEKATN